MKIIKNISAFGFILACAIAISGCAKINQVSPTAVQASQLFKDSTGLSETVTGLYSTLEVPEYYGADYLMLADLNSDNGVRAAITILRLMNLAHTALPPPIFLYRILTSPFTRPLPPQIISLQAKAPLKAHRRLI